MKRRVAKKQHKKLVLARREALGHPKPVPPVRKGSSSVPSWYVGWIRITTPGGRVKVRWVSRSRRVWRDDRCWHGGGHHIDVHALDCRVEPVDVAPATGVLAHAALLSAGLPPEHLVVLR